MRVAVISPYSEEPVSVLRRCHESVVAQSHACTHFMIADGAAEPDLFEWPVEHFILPEGHRDGGNTARAVGAISALNQGYDAIAYLNAADCYLPDHVSVLLSELARANASVGFATRTPPAGQGSGPTGLSPSQMLHTTRAARLIPIWAMMGRELAPMSVQVMLAATHAYGLSFTKTSRATVLIADEPMPNLPLQKDDRPVEFGRRLHFGLRAPS